MKLVKGGAAVLFLLCLGCGHRAPSHPASAVAPVPPLDPETQLYQKLRTADYQADGAIQDLLDAQDGAKKMAPKAGDEAGKALLSVSDLLNSAGEGLSDYEDVPDTLADYKKDFNAEEDIRHKNIDVSIAALKDVQDASDILSDLLKNVPAEHKQDLEDIAGNLNEAQSSLQEAIKSLGGKVPAEDADDNQTNPAR